MKFFFFLTAWVVFVLNKDSVEDLGVKEWILTPLTSSLLRKRLVQIYFWMSKREVKIDAKLCL